MRDGHTHLADLTGGHRTVRVVSGLGGQVKGHRQTRLALGEIALVQRVGLRRGGVPGVRPHDPGAILGTSHPERLSGGPHEWRVYLPCSTIRGVGTSFSYAVGPLMAFGGLGLLILLLRWTFRRGVSVVAAPPPSYVEGEIWRRELEDAGIRATLAQTLDGPRVMVWPADASRARAHLGPRA